MIILNQSIYLASFHLLGAIKESKRNKCLKYFTQTCNVSSFKNNSYQCRECQVQILDEAVWISVVKGFGQYILKTIF